MAWNDGVRPHNNLQDARRHARWSRRMAEEIDPSFAAAAGLVHEQQNLLESAWENSWAPLANVARGMGFPMSRVPDLRQTFAESVMDMRNNAEGLRAAQEKRRINETNLQTRPLRPLDELSGRQTPTNYPER